MFKPYTQNQSQLLPQSLEESVAPDHLARLISHSVDQLDISMIEQTYSNNGQHAYHPSMLLKVLIYGYASGIRSSRKLSDKLHEDIVFMWLSGRQDPDFRTIADFRKDKLTDFKSLFEQVLAYQHEHRSHPSRRYLTRRLKNSGLRLQEQNAIPQTVIETKDQPQGKDR